MLEEYEVWRVHLVHAAAMHVWRHDQSMSIAVESLLVAKIGQRR